MTRLSAAAILTFALSTALAATTTMAAQTISLPARTAGELADYCGVNPSEPAADAKINFCVGFAQGALAVEQHYTADKKTICIPSPGPKREDTMREFSSWVRAMPERRSMPSAAGLVRFMTERFPCK